MSLASIVVKKAASQIGTKESPADSNMQKYGKAYGMNGVPWCCIFVWWVFKQSSASKYFYDGKKVAYCPYVVNWAKKEGVWKGREYKPVPGDIILFANKGTACHIGIVEKRIDKSNVQTIEGNTSAGNNANGGQVQRRIRNYNKVGSSWYILGFVHPKWPTTSTSKSSTKKTSTESKKTESKSSKTKYVKYVIVAESGLNFRKGPGTSYPVNRTKKKGTVMNIGKIKGDWGQTKTGDWGKIKSGKQVYMKKK